MTNSEAIRDELDKTFAGKSGYCSRHPGVKHVECRGLTARRAAIFPFQLCRAILRGMREQLRRDGVFEPGVVGLHQSGFVADSSCGSILLSALAMERPKYIDDLTGQPLPEDLVRQGRKLELDYFCEKQVWVKRPYAEARQRTGKAPISVRWVDTNKGDNECPNVRCRLVARQIRRHGEEAIFAPTPPLEALRTVLCVVATDFPEERLKSRDPHSEERFQVSFVDISRAYFNAKCDQSNPTYVDSPPEDQTMGRCVGCCCATCMALELQPMAGSKSTHAHSRRIWDSSKALLPRVCLFIPKGD